MSVYLVPNTGDMDQISEVIKRAGLDLVTPSSIREFILNTQNGNVVCAIGSNELLVLNRHPETLLDELPTVVMSAPGLQYMGEWVSLASSMHVIDWTELANKLKKSGHLANSPEQLADRRTDLADPSMDTRNRRPSLSQEDEAASNDTPDFNVE